MSCDLDATIGSARWTYYRCAEIPGGAERLEKLVDTPTAPTAIASVLLPLSPNDAWHELRTVMEIRLLPDLIDEDRRLISGSPSDLFLWHVRNHPNDRYLFHLSPYDEGISLLTAGAWLYEEEFFCDPGVEQAEQRTSDVPLPTKCGEQRRRLDGGVAKEVLLSWLEWFVSRRMHVSFKDLTSLHLRLQRQKELESSAPAELDVAVRFSERSSLAPNGLLDAGEEVLLEVAVENHGPGLAYGIRIEGASLDSDVELQQLPRELGDLSPGKKLSTTIVARAASDLEAEAVRLRLEVSEARGYDPPPVDLILPARAFVTPELKIDRVWLSDGRYGNGNGVAANGEIVELEADIRNMGPGPALGTQAGLRLPTGVRILEENGTDLGELEPGAAKRSRWKLALDRDFYQQELALTVVALDGRGREVASAESPKRFDLEVRFPVLTLSHRLLDGNSPDSVGDRNGLVSNGERIELELRAANRGSLEARGVRITPACDIDGLVFEQDAIEFGDLPAKTESAVARLNLIVPRGFRADGVVPIEFLVRQDGFPNEEITIDLPFLQKEPQIIVGPTRLPGLRSNRRENRVLRLQNVGTMPARNVRVLVRPDERSLQIWDDQDFQILEKVFVQPELPMDGPGLDLTLDLVAKREAIDTGPVLIVTIEQEGFATSQLRIPVDVVEQTAEVDLREASRSPAGARWRGVDDLTPPLLQILEPTGSGQDLVTVSEAEIFIAGVASDESGIFELRVEGRDIALAPNGRFEVRQRLAYGKNELEIRAMDLNGNVSVETVRVSRLEARNDGRVERSDRALIFVTDAYLSWDRLANPIADGRALRRVLETRYGFEVELFENLDRRDLLAELRRAHSLATTGKDQLLIFFAGHGAYDRTSRQGYLVTRDSDKHDAVYETYLSYARLAVELDSLPQEHILVVLDTCFGGSFDRRLSELRNRGSFDGHVASRDEVIRRKLARRSRLYLASGGMEYVPDGVPGAHSPFVRRLLDALDGPDADGVITQQELRVQFEALRPEPRAGSFGTDEANSDFLFIRQR